jgi:hypothetical protein
MRGSYWTNHPRISHQEGIPLWSPQVTKKNQLQFDFNLPRRRKPPLLLPPPRKPTLRERLLSAALLPWAGVKWLVQHGGEIRSVVWLARAALAALFVVLGFGAWQGEFAGYKWRVEQRRPPPPATGWEPIIRAPEMPSTDRTQDKGT